jgi:lysophospholipase L1-like esterase
LLAEGRWDAVLETLQAGDYVFIQFGHNDQKSQDPTRYANPTSGYYNNLLRFVEDTRDKGATPILLSSIVRRKFNEFGTLEDTHGLYPLVTRQVASDHEVTFIDHLSMTEAFVSSLGDEPSKEYYVWVEAGQYEKLPDGKQDDTHLSVKGATQYARFVAEAIRDSDLPLQEYVVIE